MKQIPVSLVLAACIIPLSLQAGLFGWMGKKEGGATPETASTNTVKRLHLTLTDKAAEKELLQLTDVKRLLFQEKQVLLLLIDEKKRDLSNLDSELSSSFGVKQDRNYRYDAKEMAIYEAGERTGTGTNVPAAEPRLIKKLAPADSGKFASLATAKQFTQEDLAVLVRLVREKEAASARIENAFNEKFSMSRDRNYWYDPTTMQLFELVNPSRKGVVQ